MDAILQNDIFSLYENWCILIKNSHKFVSKGPVNNNSALIQVMVYRKNGDKALSN